MNVKNKKTESLDVTESQELIQLLSQIPLSDLQDYQSAVMVLRKEQRERALYEWIKRSRFETLVCISNHRFQQSYGSG